MIRVDVGPRLIRTARELGPEITRKAEEALSSIAESFGAPHRHGGLGLRKLGPNSYEVRVSLQWRIVMIKEANRLTAYDIMDHDQVRIWLKSRGKK
jgi:hypothetical protein